MLPVWAAMPLLAGESQALLSPTPPTPPASLQHTGGEELISHCASLTFPGAHQARFIMVASRRGFRLRHRVREEMEPLDIALTNCRHANCGLIMCPAIMPSCVLKVDWCASGVLLSVL